MAFAAEPAPLGGGFWADIFTFRLAGASPELAENSSPRSRPRVHTVSGRRSYKRRSSPRTTRRHRSCFRCRPARRRLVLRYAESRCAPPLSAASAGALVRAVPSLAPHLPTLLADLAVQLHQLDPAPLRDALHAQPEWPVDVDDLVADLATAAARLDDTDLATHDPHDARRTATTRTWRSRLSRRLPSPQRHRRPSRRDRRRLDRGTLGPPAFDVAFTALLLAHPPIVVGPALVRPLRLAGQWLAHRFVTGYRRRVRTAGMGPIRPRTVVVHATPCGADTHRRDNTR